MVANNSMSLEDFARKVNWEGGTDEAFAYGLRFDMIEVTDDTSSQFCTAWRTIQDIRESKKWVAAMEVIENVMEEYEV